MKRIRGRKALEIASSNTASDSTLIVRDKRSDNDGTSQSGASSIETTAIPIDHTELAGHVHRASGALGRIRDLTSKPVETDDKGYYGQVIVSVLERLNIFTDKVKQIAEVHPYSKAAYLIITGVFTVVGSARTVDQNMLALLEILDNTFKLIEDTHHIEAHPSYNRILSKLAKKTEHCALFIEKYAYDPNFWIRTGKNLMKRPIQPQIQKYEDAFTQILAELGIHLALHTEKSTAHIEETVDHLLQSSELISETLDLSNLPYAAGAGLNTEKKCLPKTRVEVLDEIFTWAEDADDTCPRLFWLTGPAGTGKSAIAHSIAIRCRDKGRLGSFFSFDRNYSTERRQDKVFSTIARDLADLDPQLKRELAKVVHKKPYLQSTTDLRIQWRDLLYEPLRVTSIGGPILVVIDALDESGDEILRQDLLKVLAKETSSLPPGVRFLVTSRPEKDITLMFGGVTSHSWHIRTKLMDSIPEIERNRDILTYFKENLVEEDSLRDDQLNQLVDLSRGVFQWANLALQFLKGLGNSSGLTITERYEDLIDSKFIETINNPLDTMYTQILSSLFNSRNPRVMLRFRSIIGSIVGASEPLSLQSLITLRGENASLSKRKEDIKVMIQDMGSVLSGIDDPSLLICPHHVSFREYLLNKHRSKEFWIDLSHCHRDFAFGCLRTMMEELRFNICNISNSHKLNTDDEGLPKRVSSSISAPLSYSSRFWVLHVSSTTFHPLLARKVEEFLNEGFLMWLEALSLLKAINVAAKLMSALISWCSGQESHKSLYDFAVDGKRFVRLFGATIAVSTPHIYLSALPFCPQDSIIYRTFIDRFPNSLRIASEPISHWPVSQRGANVGGPIACICFSHKEEYLAVLSEDGSFRLLDSETFDVLSTKTALLDKERVRAIQFLIDDKSLVFATQTEVFSLNIPTGGVTRVQNIRIPSLATEITFSHDGKFVASFQEYESIFVWNLENETQVISIPFDQSADTSYGFSNGDGDTFVTYHVDIGARVWDLKTGTVLHGPFQRRLSDINNSMPNPTNPMPTFDNNYSRSKISPNGRQIIFIDDTRLHVWNFRNNTSFTLHGYKSWIAKLVISPDGDCVIAESFGRLTVRDMNGAKLHYDTNDRLYCTAFSKDGKRFAMSNGDRLHVWELEGWQDSADIYHSTRSVPNLSFVDASPDGKHFLAQSADEKYHEIWDVNSAKSIHKLGGIFFPVFSPMSRYFGYILKTGAVKIYDIGTGTTKKFPEPDQGTEGLMSSHNETRRGSMPLSSQNRMRLPQRSMSYQSGISIPPRRSMSYQNGMPNPPQYSMSQNETVYPSQRSMPYQNGMPILPQYPMSQNEVGHPPQRSMSYQNGMPIPPQHSMPQNEMAYPPQRSMSYHNETAHPPQRSMSYQNGMPIPPQYSTPQNEIAHPPQRSMSYHNEMPFRPGRQHSMSQNERMSLPPRPMSHYNEAPFPTSRRPSMSQNEMLSARATSFEKNGVRPPPQRSMSYQNQSEMILPRHGSAFVPNRMVTQSSVPHQNEMAVPGYNSSSQNRIVSRPQRSMSYQSEIPTTTIQVPLPDERAERITFSQNEMQIATLSQGVIRIWDLDSSQIVDTLFLPDTTTGEFKSFKGSPNFRYFAYALSNEDIYLFRRTGTQAQRILLDFLPDKSWTGSDDFTFSFDEKHILISRGPTVFRLDLITKTCQKATLQKHENDLFDRHIYSTRSSNALLIETVKLKGYKIWNALSGQLLYSAQLEYPDVQNQGLVLSQRYLFTLTVPRGRVRVSALKDEKDDPVCFSSNRVHSIQGLPLGVPARLREDGWVVTQNNELLFWVPKNYHQTLHIPRLKYIVGEKSNELDLSLFSHGESWSTCHIDSTTVTHPAHAFHRPMVFSQSALQLSNRGQIAQAP